MEKQPRQSMNLKLVLNDEFEARSSQMSRGSSNILVAIRVRPENQKERSSRYKRIVRVLDSNVIIFDPADDGVPPTPGAEPRILPPGLGSTMPFLSRRSREERFAFDRVFGTHVRQLEIYENTTKFLIDGVLDGYAATVFAYGATGAGKTYTMMGTDESGPGVMVLTLIDLFAMIEKNKHQKTFKVTMTYLEVYNEMIRDLLLPAGSEQKALDLREDPVRGMRVAGLTELFPESADEVLQFLSHGNQNRAQHGTEANAVSSRSHAVLQIFVQQQDRDSGVSLNVKYGKLSLIDLAGSERAAVTKNSGERLVEGANINKSLLALGNCINALGNPKNKDGYVPYRNSKLTRLLKDSLGGNCRTVMIAAISPSSMCFEDTHNTLKYANRAKNIKTKVVQSSTKLNAHISQYVQIIGELKGQVDQLKAELLAERSKPPTVVEMQSAKERDTVDDLREQFADLHQHQMSIRSKITDIEKEELKLLQDIYVRSQTVAEFSIMHPELTPDDFPLKISTENAEVRNMKSRQSELRSKKLSLKKQLRKCIEDWGQLQAEIPRCLESGLSRETIQSEVHALSMEWRLSEVEKEAAGYKARAALLKKKRDDCRSALDHVKEVMQFLVDALAAKGLLDEYTQSEHQLAVCKCKVAGAGAKNFDINKIREAKAAALPKDLIEDSDDLDEEDYTRDDLLLLCKGADIPPSSSHVMHLHRYHTSRSSARSPLLDPPPVSGGPSGPTDNAKIVDIDMDVESPSTPSMRPSFVPMLRLASLQSSAPTQAPSQGQSKDPVPPSRPFLPAPSLSRDAGDEADVSDSDPDFGDPLESARGPTTGPSGPSAPRQTAGEGVGLKQSSQAQKSRAASRKASVPPSRGSQDPEPRVKRRATTTTTASQQPVPRFDANDPRLRTNLAQKFGSSAKKSMFDINIPAKNPSTSAASRPTLSRQSSSHFLLPTASSANHSKAPIAAQQQQIDPTSHTHHSSHTAHSQHHSNAVDKFQEIASIQHQVRSAHMDEPIGPPRRRPPAKPSSKPAWGEDDGHDDKGASMEVDDSLPPKVEEPAPKVKISKAKIQQLAMPKHPPSRPATNPPAAGPPAFNQQRPRTVPAATSAPSHHTDDYIGGYSQPSLATPRDYFHDPFLAGGPVTDRSALGSPKGPRQVGARRPSGFPISNGLLSGNGPSGSGQQQQQDAYTPPPNSARGERDRDYFANFRHGPPSGLSREVAPAVAPSKQKKVPRPSFMPPPTNPLRNDLISPRRMTMLSPTDRSSRSTSVAQPAANSGRQNR